MKKPRSTPPLKKAIKRFGSIRETRLKKRPGTSEFLDWLDALQSFGDEPHSPKDLSEDKPAPYPETLFKMKEDRDAHRQRYDNTSQ